MASSLLSRIVVPFPLISRWRNGERTDDLAQTLVDHGTSFCVEPERPCSRSLAMLKVSPPSSRCGHDMHRRSVTFTSRWRQRSERIEPRTYFADASVDQTDVRKQVRSSGQA